MTSTWYTELSLTITNKNGSEYYGQIVRAFSTMDDVAYDLDGYARMFNTSTYFTVNIPYVLIYMNGYWVVLGDQKILGEDINGAVDKANKDGSGNVITDTYATKTELDNLELITVEDIDTICNTIIQTATASEVTF